MNSEPFCDGAEAQDGWMTAVVGTLDQAGRGTNLNAVTGLRCFWRGLEEVSRRIFTLSWSGLLGSAPA
jgi:hypothetical protein